MKLNQQDALEFLKRQEDYSADILFCDPPYALGSEVTIKEKICECGGRIKKTENGYCCEDCLKEY